jgi:uncharacterized protein (DUF2147 family)
LKSFCLIALMLAVWPSAAEAAIPEGVYTNPKKSVYVRAEPCGANLCGVVIWASEKAQAIATRGGTPNFVGSRLFRDFVPVEPDRWKGKVFVPDFGMTFSGTITRVSATLLRGKGCVFGNFICKSEDWIRVDLPSNPRPLRQ